MKCPGCGGPHIVNKYLSVLCIECNLSTQEWILQGKPPGEHYKKTVAILNKLKGMSKKEQQTITVKALERWYRVQSTGNLDEPLTRTSLMHKASKP